MITAGMLTGKELTEKADGIAPEKPTLTTTVPLSPPQLDTTGNASGVASRGISTCETRSVPDISRYLPVGLVLGPHLAVFQGFEICLIMKLKMGFGLFFRPGQEKREDESVFNSPTLAGWLSAKAGAVGRPCLLPTPTPDDRGEHCVDGVRAPGG